MHRRLLKTYITTPNKLAEIGAKKISKITKLFSARLPADYYFIQDNESKSAYEPYTTEKIDDKHAAISHILVSTDKGRELQEISEISTVVGALSKDTGIKKIYIFYPDEVSQEVDAVLMNSI